MLWLAQQIIMERRFKSLTRYLKSLVCCTAMTCAFLVDLSSTNQRPCVSLSVLSHQIDLEEQVRQKKERQAAEKEADERGRMRVSLPAIVCECCHDIQTSIHPWSWVAWIPETPAGPTLNF